ncbi:hypothetical protein EDB85DRAFT_1901390 [Lactarius pseudohatsudake]|nr:hypothetical protein EDB85DRAFT_1901390 [Lactarius pseudohatsudake]
MWPLNGQWNLLFAANAAGANETRVKREQERETRDDAVRGGETRRDGGDDLRVPAVGPDFRDERAAREEEGNIFEPRTRGFYTGRTVATQTKMSDATRTGVEGQSDMRRGDARPVYEGLGSLLQGEYGRRRSMGDGRRASEGKEMASEERECPEPGASLQRMQAEDPGAPQPSPQLTRPVHAIFVVLIVRDRPACPAGTQARAGKGNGSYGSLLVIGPGEREANVKLVTQEYDVKGQGRSCGEVCGADGCSSQG